MKLNNISHVFFDLDHTLWDFDKNSGLTFKKIFELNNVQVDLKAFLKVYEPINFNYWKLYREEKIDKKSLRYKRLSDTFQILNVEIKSRVINKLSIDYIDYLCTFNHLFDGTIEILDYLDSKYELHIITNGFKEAQQGKLNTANIDHYFKTVTNSEMVGVKKPNPKIFSHALSLANAKIEQSIMIGDNLEADVFGALDIGLDAICYNYHKEKEIDGIKFVNNLLDLKHYL